MAFPKPPAFLGCHQAVESEQALPDVPRAPPRVSNGCSWCCAQAPLERVRAQPHTSHTGSVRANINTHPARSKYVDSVWNGLCRQEDKLNTTDNWFIQLLH